jgi:hypothetical protein
MAAENPTWGEGRIANELKLKLTIRVSPRPVGKYLRDDSPVRTPDPKQRCPKRERGVRATRRQPSS